MIYDVALYCCPICGFTAMNIQMDLEEIEPDEEGCVQKYRVLSRNGLCDCDNPFMCVKDGLQAYGKRS